MANEGSSIVHGPKIPMVIVRHNLVWVCEQAAIKQGLFTEAKKGGAANRTLVVCAAALLNNFIYWHDSRGIHNRLARQENAFAKIAEKEPPHTIHDWVYLTISQLQSSLFNQWGENKVAQAKGLIVRAGFIKEEHNGLNSWDKTMRYRLVTKAVQIACNAYIAVFKDTPDREPYKPEPPQTDEDKAAYALAKQYISTWQSMFSVVNGKNLFAQHMKTAIALAKKLKRSNQDFAAYLSYLQKQEMRTKAPDWDYLGTNFGQWLKFQNGKSATKKPDEKATQATGLGSQENIDKAMENMGN